MKKLNDIIAQMQTVGLSKEKLKEPLVKRLEGVIEDRENIFYFTKSYYAGSNGLLFLTSKGILFVGTKGTKLFVQRIEGERVDNILFDPQMFNNSTLTVVTKSGDFIFESINKEDGPAFMAKYKRYHGIVFGKKRTQTPTKKEENTSNIFTGIMISCSIFFIALALYALSQIDISSAAPSSNPKERTVMIKEGNGMNLGNDTGKIVVGDSGSSEFSIGPNMDFAAPKKHITEILKAKKPEAKKEEVNKLNDLISRLGKMVVEGFAKLTSDERIVLMVETEDGKTEAIEIKPKDSKLDIKELIKEKSLHNKSITDKFSCDGEAKLNEEDKLVLTGCTLR